MTGESGDRDNILRLARVMKHLTPRVSISLQQLIPWEELKLCPEHHHISVK